MDTVVNTGTPKKEFDVELAVSEYQKGVGLKDLARKFNVNISTVSRALKKSGVEMRGRGRPKKVTI